MREDMPTKGSRTFQSAAMDVEFKNREAHKLMRDGDWEGAHKIHESISPLEHQAVKLAEHKIGGRHGGATFDRSDILIPLPKAKDGE
jgi:hypothetical protein